MNLLLQHYMHDASGVKQKYVSYSGFFTFAVYKHFFSIKCLINLIFQFTTSETEGGWHFKSF